MAKPSDALVEDGKTLQKKFSDADELIVAGELDFRDFSSPLAKRVIYLQRELSKSAGTPENYDEKKVADFRNRTKRFLTDLKDGSLTDSECKDINRKMKADFPKLKLPKAPRSGGRKNTGYRIERNIIQ